MALDVACVYGVIVSTHIETESAVGSKSAPEPRNSREDAGWPEVGPSRNEHVSYHDFCSTVTCFEPGVFRMTTACTVRSACATLEVRDLTATSA